MRFKLGKWALAGWSKLGETEASFCIQTACEGLILLRDKGNPQYTALSKCTSLVPAAWSPQKDSGWVGISLTHSYLCSWGNRKCLPLEVSSWLGSSIRACSCCAPGDTSDPPLPTQIPSAEQTPLTCAQTPIHPQPDCKVKLLLIFV